MDTKRQSCFEEASAPTLAMPQNTNCSSSAPTGSLSLAPWHVLTIDYLRSSTPFRLPPAINFNAYRSSANGSGRLDPHPSSSSRSNKKTFQQDHDLAHDSNSQFEISIESPHSSLNPALYRSPYITEKVSEKDVLELQKYAASFKTS
jgi:hypothetical protein